MTLSSDVAFFWRFGAVIQFATTSWVAEPILEEARDEIESIARHSKSAGLRAKARELLDATRDRRPINTPTEQVVNEILKGIIGQHNSASATMPTGINAPNPDVKACG